MFVDVLWLSDLLDKFLIIILLVNWIRFLMEMIDVKIFFCIDVVYVYFYEVY